MDEDKISDLFGGGKLSYDELIIKAADAGVEVGDVAALRGEYASKLHSLRCRSALERNLDKSGAKNRELIAKVIDMGRVTSDEDGVYGLDEQFDELKASAPYLFEDKPKNPPVITSGFTHSAAEQNPDRLDDFEYYRRVKKL